MKQWRTEYPEAIIIIMTAYGNPKSAVECIKSGAYNFLTNPFDNVLLLKTLENATQYLELNVLTELNKRESQIHRQCGIIGKSPTTKKAFDMIELIAKSDYSCLFINGECGSGKGFVARAIHQMGKRSNRPFVELSCSALPHTLN